ncbi:MAG: tRNA (adenosine(37)-N6)-dimethylallyltransferase MiaA [Marinilabiliaceae bacterium]|jgi:tRNA dimethylallyltransferase|nr:tRNA (adenosine(37)-N6)-dimethylallyltransferase MiaA [Marinilabiliaceae bacterium]
MQNTLITILGPTGIGKSRLAIELAEHLGTEIISSDSRQFYREMTIGTAVPAKEDLLRIKHHFIQHISVHDYYSASIFEQDVLAFLTEFFRKKKVVIMAGGSGLYINAVCGSIDNIPDIDKDTRLKYLERLEKEGIESLRNELKLVDPEYYSISDLRNPKRILRALEIFASTGNKYSSYLGKGGKKRDFRIIRIGLTDSRETLYKRINKRVDAMMAAGLEQEARSLYALRDLNALNTVGYRELFSYFDGSISRDEAIELIKRNSRRYAKRQLTWWSRESGIKWFAPGQKNEILDYLSDLIPGI